MLLNFMWLFINKKTNSVIGQKIET